MDQFLKNWCKYFYINTYLYKQGHNIQTVSISCQYVHYNSFWSMKCAQVSERLKKVKTVRTQVLEPQCSKSKYTWELSFNYLHQNHGCQQLLIKKLALRGTLWILRGAFWYEHHKKHPFHLYTKILQKSTFYCQWDKSHHARSKFEGKASINAVFHKTHVM